MEKIYRVKLNSKGMPNFSTAEEIEQGWIPCSERLPSESGYYLTTLRDVFGEIEICIAWFAHEDDYNGSSEWREVTDEDTVLAWQILPKPWKGADDD